MVNEWNTGRKARKIYFSFIMLVELERRALCMQRAHNNASGPSVLPHFSQVQNLYS